jgi:hypothetical protein
MSSHTIATNHTSLSQSYAPNHRYDQIKSQTNNVTLTIALITVSDRLECIISIVMMIPFTVSHSPVKNHILINNIAKFLKGK